MPKFGSGEKEMRARRRVCKRRVKEERRELVLGYYTAFGWCPEFYRINTYSLEPKCRNHNRKSPCQF